MKTSALRLNVNLSTTVAFALRKLEARYGSVTEAIRHAISTEVFVQDAIDRGARLLIEEPGEWPRYLIWHQDTKGDTDESCV